MSRRKSHILWSGLLALAVLASACTAPTATTAPQATSAPQATAAPQATSAPQATQAPAPTDAPVAAAEPYTLPTFPAPDEVEGDILTAGSSTVFPLSERMAELFEQEGFAGGLTVDSIGTGAGFERFCTTGETDISNASRAINAKEIANCAAISRTPVEFRVGTDALAVVINPQNTWAESMTLAELALVFSTATNWSDVRADWPAEPIKRYTPGTDSGTFDYFIEAVMQPANNNNNAEGKAAFLNAQNLQLSEDDNVLVQGVEGDQYAIGFFGYAYFAEESDRLKAVSLVKGTDLAAAVAPSQETVDGGTYPLARPLYIYSTAQIIQEKPQVAAFIKFYLDTVNNEIIDVGYFPAPEKAQARAQGRLVYAGGVTVDPSLAEGDIVTAGSSTVFPLSERMAEKYSDEGYAGTITIDSVGTGAGFERFCKTGETDIANASRAIRQAEIDNCTAIGRTPLEFRVGTDALAVVVSQENTFIDYLTASELAKAFSTAATWADVRAGWPAEPIQRFSPGTDSGTFDYFVEAILAPANPKADGSADAEAGEKAILEAANIQLSEDDNVLAQGVEGSPNAIGYFGYAYYAAEAGALKAVPIVSASKEKDAAGDAEKLKAAAVAPDLAAVNAGTYPLARPLFIYSDAALLAEKPQVANFILFYLANVNNEIIDVGYFPATDNALGDAVTNWLGATEMMP